MWLRLDRLEVGERWKQHLVREGDQPLLGWRSRRGTGSTFIPCGRTSWMCVGIDVGSVVQTCRESLVGDRTSRSPGKAERNEMSAPGASVRSEFL